jgi:5,6-dimethylbenzimidazole synthase
MNPHRLSDADVAAVYRTIHSRRDIREFVPGPLAPGLLERLLLAAHAAPSVGYMQPWRLIHVTDPDLRTSISGIVEAERQRTAAALPTRNEEFLKLKVEGLKNCAEVVVVALMHGREQHIFGRRTMPEMDLASAACAIQNMWLAARAEGIGLGWVSIFEPTALSALLSMPTGARPIAILCIGRVLSFPERPVLDALGWGQRMALERVVFENQWPADAQPTPPAY